MPRCSQPPAVTYERGDELQASVSLCKDFQMFELEPSIDLLIHSATKFDGYKSALLTGAE